MSKFSRFFFLDGMSERSLVFLALSAAKNTYVLIQSKPLNLNVDIALKALKHILFTTKRFIKSNQLLSMTWQCTRIDHTSVFRVLELCPRSKTFASVRSSTRFVICNKYIFNFVILTSKDVQSIVSHHTISGKILLVEYKTSIHITVAYHMKNLQTNTNSNPHCSKCMISMANVKRILRNIFSHSYFNQFATFLLRRCRSLT